MRKKNLFVFKIPFLILFTSFILLPVHPANAETKTFIKEYTYHAGDEDSKNSSRTIALREVKRLLLEELGTYLENQTEVKNFHMTKDQITTLTMGIVSAEVIKETWNGKVYWLKAKMSANQQDVIKSIDSLRKDRNKVKELEELREKSEDLLKENERLNKELKIAKGGTKHEAAQAYKRNINNLSATEWVERGYKLSRFGNYIDAQKAFGKAIELNPQYAQAYLARGAGYGIFGNYQQAISDFNEAIELNPQNATAYYSRGLTFSVLGNYQQAITDYNKAIELNPQYAGAYFSRGIAYSSLGNNQQAIADYNKTIELNPQNAEAFYNRGVFIYGKLGNYQQEITDLNKTIELNPLYADAYFARGLAYGILGIDQQSIKDIRIAARLGQEKAQDFLRSREIEW
jgi:tetratricopeptide (TPR) repeat protein